MRISRQPQIFFDPTDSRLKLDQKGGHKIWRNLTSVKSRREISSNF
jgi:hypothetical protein